MNKFILIVTLTFGTVANAYVYVDRCANYTDKVDYSFISCINRNFNTIETEINLNSQGHVALYYCANYGDKLDFSFQSCVNENFRTIARVKNGFFSHCSNFKDKGVDYFYISCVNNNFETAANLLNRILE